MSGHMSERRFEVVASTRRRWSREEKLTIVKEASGVCTNVSAVARRHGLNPALLYRWKKELGSGGSDAATLLPVAVVSGSMDDEVASGSTDAETRIEIVLDNGRRICAPQNIEGTNLKRLLTILES